MRLILVAVLSLIATNAFASCDVSSPVNLPVLGEAINAIANNGNFDGTYNLKGRADCESDLSDLANDTAALNAALSAPVWLGDSEKFRISGGIGFAEGGSTAVGANAVVRLTKSLAGYGGVAASSDNFVGHAGLSYGF